MILIRGAVVLKISCKMSDTMQREGREGAWKVQKLRRVTGGKRWPTALREKDATKRQHHVDVISVNLTNNSVLR
jgi:hypothetical protein